MKNIKPNAFLKWKLDLEVADWTIRSFGCGILLIKEFDSSVLWFTFYKADNYFFPTFLTTLVDENVNYTSFTVTLLDVKMDVHSF